MDDIGCSSDEDVMEAVVMEAMTSDAFSFSSGEEAFPQSAHGRVDEQSNGVMLDDEVDNFFMDHNILGEPYMSCEELFQCCMW
jgi:hypothetical protein